MEAPVPADTAVVRLIELPEQRPPAGADEYSQSAEISDDDIPF